MPVLEVGHEQVLELVKQLPEPEKRALLIQLATDGATRRAQREAKAEAVARRIGKERGLDWDTLSEEERIAFLDELIHEERQCSV